MIETRTVGEQLLTRFQRELAEGVWPPGGRFAAERELAEQYGISRATANKVLAKLVSEGWLEIRRGQGTYVNEVASLFAVLRQLESFTAFAEKLGFQPGTEVLECVREEAGDQAELFGIQPRDKLWRVVRRRLLEGEPVIFEERWLPETLYPQIEKRELEGSFYRLSRERFGLEVATESATVEAVLAPAAAGFGDEKATLRLNGKGRDSEGRVLWLQRLYYRGDAFELAQESSPQTARPWLNFRLKPHFFSQFQS